MHILLSTSSVAVLQTAEMPNAALAPLAFGDHYSRPYRSMAEAADEASRLTPGFLDHEFLDRDNLSMVTSVARINGLSLVALSTSPSRIAFGRGRNRRSAFLSRDWHDSKPTGTYSRLNPRGALCLYRWGNQARSHRMSARRWSPDLILPACRGPRERC